MVLRELERAGELIRGELRPGRDTLSAPDRTGAAPYEDGGSIRQRGPLGRSTHLALAPSLCEHGVYGVHRRLYGKTYFGNERTTFVLDADGTVARVLRKVKPAEHDELVLSALREIGPRAA